jgi:hypothetical protein
LGGYAFRSPCRTTCSCRSPFSMHSHPP